MKLNGCPYASVSQSSAMRSDLQTICPPNVVTDFVARVVAGPSCPSHRYSPKVLRIAKSLSEDLCYAATRGQWKMPKHVELAMSLHHLTTSSEVVTLINRFGHCVSYSKLLELETSLAYAVQRSDSILPSNISMSNNAISHTCWDNFDLNEETLSGASTTHTTHGIVIQQITGDNIPTVHMATEDVPTKSHSFQYVPPPLQRASVTMKAEPAVSQLKGISADTSISAFMNSKGLLWILAHGLFSGGNVPHWSGWLSRTADEDTNSKLSQIGYLKPIMNPITQHSTVQQCLQTSMEISHKLGQQYTFVTFDLAAAKLAYNVIWNNPECYNDVFIHLGAFHITCCYLGAVGKLMTGSGFEDIVLESGICSSGSIDQVLSGKHYNRSLRVHQVMVAVLDELLLDKFMMHQNTDIVSLVNLQMLAQTPNAENFSAAHENDICQEFMQHFLAFADQAREGAFGATCRFWLQYHDCIWILLTFIQAIKENEAPVYISCLRQMCPLIFAADRLNYARYLPLYCTLLSNLISDKPDAYALLKANGLTVRRSMVPACRNAVDITIEQTINRSAKSSGGIVGFSRNTNAYYRWCLTRHVRAQFLDAARQRAGYTNATMAQGESDQTADVKHRHRDLMSVRAAFGNFLNPMQTGEDEDKTVYCLSSGQSASDAVSGSLLSYVSMGEEAAATFIQQRLVEKSVKFHEPMCKLKLQTFQAMAMQTKVTSSKEKTVKVKAERNFLGQLLMLCQGHNICLDKLFTYPLAPIPWSLATADGSMCKTNKAELLHALETEGVESAPETFIAIIDGNAMLHSVVHVPATFGDFAQLGESGLRCPELERRP